MEVVQQPLETAPGARRSLLLRYGLAFISIAVAAWARLLLVPVVGSQFPYATFFIAILASAAYGGFGPGLVAVVIGAVSVDYFLLPHHGMFGLEGLPQYVGMAQYLGTGLGIALLGGAMHEQKKKLETRVQERTATLAEAIKSLHENEERFRLFIEHAPAELAMFDREMRYLHVSQRFRTVYGLGDRNLAGLRHYDLFPEIPERWKEVHRRGLAGEVVQEDDDQFVRADGSVQWIRWEIRPWLDKDNVVGGIVVFSEDITARKQAEQSLRDSERQFRILGESIPQLTWMANADGWIYWYNQRWFQYTGTTLEQMQGWGWQSVHDPDELPRVMAQWQASIATGELFDMVFPLRGADGVFRPFLTRVMPLKNAEGRVVQWFGTNTDISEQKRIEAALRVSEARLNEAQHSAHIGSWHYTADGQITWSDEMYELFKVPREQPLSWEKIFAVIHPGDLDAIRNTVENGLKAGNADSKSEYRIVWPDGQIRNVVSVRKIHMDRDGRMIEAVGTVQDVTERKRAEEELHRSRQALDDKTLLFECVLDSMSEGVVAADENGKFITWNPAAERMLGRGPSEIPREKWSEHYEVYRPDKVTLLPVDETPLALALRGETGTVDMNIRKPGATDGVWIAGSSTPLRNKEGKTIGGVVALRDITNMKAHEEEIRKLNDDLEQKVAQRTAQLEATNKELLSFTYSAAHDLRTPVRHINAYAHLLIEELGSGITPEAQKLLQRMKAGATRIGTLLDDLLNLAGLRRSDLRLQVSGLKSIVEEVVADLKPECNGRDIEWRIGDLPFLECDRGLMKQLFQNLLANAVKFTRPRPHAIIEVGVMDHQGFPAVFVRDNGVGFNMEHANKLFGVFQRLHRSEDFEGTGVGLAIVERIVDKHQGRIWAESELDRGATFFFTIGSSEPTRPV